MSTTVDHNTNEETMMNISTGRDAFTTGVDAIGAIDSPTTIDEYRVVLVEGTQSLHLQQSLVVLEVPTETTAGSARQMQLAQIRDLELRNHHHETPLFKAYLRRHLEVPGLSGRADHRVATAYPVDAVIIGPDGEVIEKTSPLSVLPSTGTRVHMAGDAVVRKFIRGGKGLLRVGYLARPTHLPLALAHNGEDDDGAAEARHFGCFGPSGSGKTTMLAHLMTGWARHRRMGQFVLDHDGDLSALEIGRDGHGHCHFSLARAFAAVGRDPSTVVRVGRNDLRIEHASDLAAALRIEHFFERLGVGAGEKRHAVERAVTEALHDRLQDTPFAELSYDDAIDDVCHACAETYAASGRDQRLHGFIDAAKGGSAEKRLREIWGRVQSYAAQPVSMRELVERALFDGDIVIVNLSGADGAFDELLTKRLVRTLLDVAHLAYVLKQGAAKAETWRGRYQRYRPYFDRYKAREVNAIAVIDEAHMVASEDDVREEGSVAAQLAQAIRRTRKYGLGFCFATQEISSIAKSIFRNLGTYIFGYGLKSSSEAERVKEVLADESAFRVYRGFPEPKSSGRFSFMVSGAAVPLANGAPVPLTAYSSQEEFFEANPGLSDPGAIAVPEPPPLRQPVAEPATGLDQLLGS
jgi:hypothetical protein